MRLYDVLDRGCSINPDGVAFTDGKRDLTYRETRRAADRIARRLSGMELGSESIVAVCSPNHVLTFVAVLGILRAGCIWLPINARYGHDEIEHALVSHDISFVFYHSQTAEIVEASLPDSPAFRGSAVIDAESTDNRSLENWIKSGDDQPLDPEQTPDTVIAIRSTGGTTGPSRGVMVTNRVYMTMFASFLSCIDVLRSPVHLAAAPLSHAAGSLCLLTLAHGGTNVVLSKALPEDILATIQDRKVTLLFLPPTLIYMLLKSPEIGRHDYGSLQYLVYAGAPMSVDRLREAITVFGPVLLQGYGQAEAPFFCTCLMPEEHVVEPNIDGERRLASCGRATTFTRVAVMDDDDRILPDEEVGEIVVRGDIVMKGYYRNPDATAEVSRGGWHHTGDMGYRDTDGYYYIVDRKRDIIISGGFNIAPSEIERVLWAHPAVQDCAVIGVPDETWGEAVKAIVELKDGTTVTEAELQEMCTARLGSMKKPRTIEFWPELPRSSVGKVSKREIRARFWGPGETAPKLRKL